MDRNATDHGELVVVVAEEEEEEEEVVLPGFRFHPSDEELVTFYLRRKVERKPLRMEIIKQMDIYKYDPWDLPKASSIGGEKEWYFFCLRGRKYKNSVRPNRVTGSGFWKATGIDRPVYSDAGGDCVGLKKSLVFYRGSAGKGTKTDWMMHEFRLPPDGGERRRCGTNSPSTDEAEIWTICRIFKRNNFSCYNNHRPCRKNTSSSFESDTGDHVEQHCLPAAMAIEARQPLQAEAETLISQQYLPAREWNVLLGPQTPSSTAMQLGVLGDYQAMNSFLGQEGDWDDEFTEIIESSCVQAQLIS